jgi:hypothetical protein
VRALLASREEGKKMIDGAICIGIFFNLLAWNTPYQKTTAFFFLGIGLSRLL